MVGVWPRASLALQPDSRHWAFARRMFPHPELSSKIVHPHDVENWQRVAEISGVSESPACFPAALDLYISTSAGAPYEWAPQKFFQPPDKWQSYGKVY